MAKNKYEVVNDAGVGFEVGKIIETDSLHPSLLQHVRQVSVGAKGEGESEAKPEAKPAGKAKAEPKPKPGAKPAEAPPPPGPPDDNT